MMAKVIPEGEILNINGKYYKYVNEVRKDSCIGCYFMGSPRCKISVLLSELQMNCADGIFKVHSESVPHDILSDSHEKYISSSVIIDSICNNDICPYYKDDLSCNKLKYCIIRKLNINIDLNNG